MKSKQTTFYCFSPPVMMASFAIEIGLLIYAVIRFKMSVAVRLASAILFLLALFQLAEYNVCGGMGASAAAWSRVGYAAITLLPPLGIHLIQVIAKRNWPIITWLAYLTAAAWVLIFGFSQSAFSGHVCAGNYIIFQLNTSLNYWFYAYYYGWLLAGVYMSTYFAFKAKKTVRKALMLLLVGYFIFLVPTTVVNTLDPQTTDGIPSIMCGFAVMFAFILAFGILPLTGKRRL